MLPFGTRFSKRNLVGDKMQCELKITTTGMGTATTGSSTGLNTGSINQPGVPNTSLPGSIGTGAPPSGLPGDDPANPGFPRRVGR